MLEREKGILLIYNDTSGPGKAGHHASKAASLLSHGRYPFDLKPFFDLIDYPTQVEDWAAVCVFGGDGTFFSAANIVGKSKRKPALVAIPTGTENVMSNSINGSIKPLTLIRRTVATLNGESNPLNRIYLQPGDYKLNGSDPKNFYWLLSAGDSGLTRRTLRALKNRGPSSHLARKVTALRAALNKTKIDNTVLVTIFDEDGLPYEEFDALEASVIKETPGKWSRVPVVPLNEKRNQILSIGRGHTKYDSRRFVYRTLFDSANATLRKGVEVFDPENINNSLLTRTPLEPNHTVVFTAQGEQPFIGVIRDSEISRQTTTQITVQPNIAHPIIEVFSAI